MLRSCTIRMSFSVLQKYQGFKSSRSSSSLTTPAISPEKPVDDPPKKNEAEESAKDTQISEPKKPFYNSQIITAAFATLKHNRPEGRRSQSLDEIIKAAKTSEELLSLSQNSTMSKHQVLKIVSTLSEWSLTGKADKMEEDPRFISLCQMLSKKPSSFTSHLASKQNDLSVVLGVTGEDEAAKVINTITLPQMIKVLTSLSVKKRRSILLLRSLSFNISRTNNKLDVKQAADVLYSLSSLNFPDEVLLEKVCSDLVEVIPKCQKSAVIGSICTSIGLLKYKDLELLDTLSDWVLKNRNICRNQDVVSLLLCLASVSQPCSDELSEMMVGQLSEDDIPFPQTWLDVVWSLCVLGAVTPPHLASILNTKFTERILSNNGENTISLKKKLLNINGVAKWTKGYKGPLLKEEDLEVPLSRSRDKQVLVGSVCDTLSNLFPSAAYLRQSVDTGMGFLIDGECQLDSKMTPSAVLDKKTGLPVPATKNGKGNRLAILVVDYHDCTRGRISVAGPMSLYTQLSTMAGWRVVHVHHTEYSPRARLLDRVSYLESLLKTAVKPVQ